LDTGVSVDFWQREYLLPLLEIEPCIVHPVAYSLTSCISRVLKGKVADRNALTTLSGDFNLQVDTGWLNKLGELFVLDEFNIVHIGLLHQYIYIQCSVT